MTAVGSPSKASVPPSSSSRGSKAGDPLGDIVFLLVMIRILNEAADAMQKAGIVIQVPEDLDAPIIADGSRSPKTVPLPTFLTWMTFVLP